MRFPMALAAALAVSAFSVTAARAGNIDFGTVELSGSASLLRSAYNHVNETSLSLNPGAAVYLAPFINIGPLLSWNLVSYDYVDSDQPDYSYSALDLGAKIGFLVNWSDGFGRPLPFFDLGLGGEFQNQKTSGSSSETGLAALLVGGIKLKVGESFYLSVFESYDHHGVSSFDNQFISGVGFSGLIGE
jgi:hypothetical protein